MYGLRSLALVLALLFASLSLSGQQAGAPPLSTLSDSQLLQILKGNLLQSQRLNAELRADLTLQVQSRAELQTRFDKLLSTQAESDRLAERLQADLRTANDSSSQAQADLRQTLSDYKEQTSLTAQVTESFKSYKAATESEIKNLKLQNDGWKITAEITAAALALNILYDILHAIGVIK